MIVGKRSFIPDGVVTVPKQAKRVYDGIAFDIWQWQQKMFDGNMATFEMARRRDTVDIIAVVGEKIVIIEEEQPFNGAFMDIPGGGNDHPEDDELAAAKRELIEETGYSFSDWRLIDCVQHWNKVDILEYTFLAYGDYSKTEINLDSGEKIITRLVDFDEFKRLIPSLRTANNLTRIFKNIHTLDDLLNMKPINHYH